MIVTIGHVSVCLLAGLLKNVWTDLHENMIKDMVSVMARIWRDLDP